MTSIIRAVAVRHGIALGKNDPILVLDTVNSLLINKFAKRQDVLINEFHSKLETVADLWNKNMENKASEMIKTMEISHRQLISELVEMHINNIVTTIADNCSDITLAQQLKTSKHIRSLNSQLITMRSMLYVNFVASIMVLISALLLLWQIIR